MSTSSLWRSSHSRKAVSEAFDSDEDDWVVASQADVSTHGLGLFGYSNVKGQLLKTDKLTQLTSGLLDLDGIARIQLKWTLDVIGCLCAREPFE